jgi:flagellar L-ring protein precursor FlgH
VKRYECHVLSMAIVLALCVPTHAQSNSLFGRSGDPTGGGNAQRPTTQPAVREAGVVLQGVTAPSRARPTANQPEPPTNVVLLHTSPFAYELPQPEEIGVHDFITVIIRVSKTATSDANLKSEKDWELKSELAKWIRLDEQHRMIPQVFPKGNPAVDFNLENEYEGKGKVGRKDTLVTRITAEVIDVKPNGNLVLQAQEKVNITDEEGYVMTLTGSCRSRDVTVDNTILSSQIANLEIDVQHTGAARDAARRGWLMRAFDFLRPF